MQYRLGRQGGMLQRLSLNDFRPNSGLHTFGPGFQIADRLDHIRNRQSSEHGN